MINNGLNTNSRYCGIVYYFDNILASTLNFSHFIDEE